MRRRSWDRRAAARARCSTSSARSSRRPRARITLDGRNPFALDAPALAAFRNEQIGFVFQDHCLLPQCTVLENVLIPTLVASDANGRHRARARDAHRTGGAGAIAPITGPAALSGGERQRAAIARALIRQPRLLLCDEPTGNLDRASADNVASVLLDLHRRQQTILVIVTHSPQLARECPIRFELTDKRLACGDPDRVSRLTGAIGRAFRRQRAGIG